MFEKIISLSIIAAFVLISSTGCMTVQHSASLVSPEAGCPIALEEVDDSNPVNTGTAVADLNARLNAKQPLTERCRDYNVTVAQSNEGVARSLHAGIATKTAPIDKSIDYIDHLARATGAVLVGIGAYRLPDAIEDQSDVTNVTSSSGSNSSSSSNSQSSSQSSSLSKVDVSMPPPGHGGGHNPPRPEPPHK